MKYLDEVDIELVNQELNFHTPDNSLVVRGGCDLFTTKPIGNDRKLYKTIDKHVNQMVQDLQMSKNMEKERKDSIHSLFGSSPVIADLLQSRSRHGSFTNRKDSTSSSNEVELVDDSPFGSLKANNTKWTFVNLITILNSTYPDHDFSNLQPTTENFHRIYNPEDLIHKFNNLMVSLGKSQDSIKWIWDRIDSYMDFIPKNNSPLLHPISNDEKVRRDSNRKQSFSGPRRSSNNGGSDSPYAGHCQIYEFTPSDQSIIEDLNYPYQTMWTNYWFIYNKKKKKVAFLYLNAINKLHYSMINGNRKSSFTSNHKPKKSGIIENDDYDDDDDDLSANDYMDEEVFLDDVDSDAIDDIEI